MKSVHDLRAQLIGKAVATQAALELLDTIEPLFVAKDREAIQKATLQYTITNHLNSEQQDDLGIDLSYNDEKCTQEIVITELVDRLLPTAEAVAAEGAPDKESAF